MQALNSLAVEQDEERRASHWSAPQWVCDCCAQVLGGDRDSASTTTRRALWRAQRALERWSLAPEGGHESVGRRPCDLCGDTGSGERFEAVIYFLPATTREAS